VVSRIAIETLCSILREKHVTFQRTRSWKRSTDALFGDNAGSPSEPIDRTFRAEPVTGSNVHPDKPHSSRRCNSFPAKA